MLAFYLSDVFPNACRVERLTALLNERMGYEVWVVSPQPYCPPLPPLGPLQHYARFRQTAKARCKTGWKSSARASRQTRPDD